MGTARTLHLNTTPERAHSFHQIEEILSKFNALRCCSGVSLKEAASKAYEQALAPHHSWAIRQAVRASLYTLPNREKFLARVGEDGERAQP